MSQQHEPNKKTKPRDIAIILSLALHIVVLIVLLLMPATKPEQFAKKNTTEVELVDAEKLLKDLKKENDDAKGQIVDQSDKALNDEIDKKTKYLSKHNQRVVKETQAQVKDKFRNTESIGGGPRSEQAGPKAAEVVAPPAPQENQAQRSEEKVQPEILTADDGVPTDNSKHALKDLIPNFKPVPPQEQPEAQAASGGGDGPSANDDHLKDVAFGVQTLLTTREFIYYSYYNRIKDKLRQYWEPKIKEKMERIMRQGRTIASTGEKTTKIIIILDRQGILQKIQVIGESGVTDLDDAAVEAFRAAAPFPNPPKGIVESDGTIKIRWDFILEA